MHDLQLTWASGESESESRRAKRVREQPYDINVRDNWIIIGVREQPYVIQVCSGRWLVDPGINGGVVGARRERARGTRGRVRARSKWKIRFPLLVLNFDFFPPTFIREGGGCGAKIFSDRRGRGGREEAWRRGRVCLSVCLCKSKSYPTALVRLKTRPSTCVGS